MEVGKKNYLSYGGFISTEKTRDYQTIATQIPRLHSFVPRNIYISRKLGKMPHEEGDLLYKRQTNTNLPSERTFMWMKENKTLSSKNCFYKGGASRAGEDEQVNNPKCAVHLILIKREKHWFIWVNQFLPAPNDGSISQPLFFGWLNICIAKFKAKETLFNTLIHSHCS